jgi:hypothetical protein
VLSSLAVLFVLELGLGAHADDASTKDVDVKIAFWYSIDDPLGTFHKRVYDLRKGEYPAAQVDAWLKTMSKDFPRYRAYICSVRLDQFPGATESEKITAVSTQELRPFLDAGLGQLRLFSRSVPSQSLGVTRPLRPLNPTLGSPGAAGFSNPPSYSYPFPYPYPRPHP